MTASPAKRLSSDNMAHALFENGLKLVTNLQD